MTTSIKTLGSITDKTIKAAKNKLKNNPHVKLVLKILLALITAVILLATMLIFILKGISNPYAWIIELVFIVLACLFVLKLNKIIGLIFTAATIAIFFWLLSGSKSMYCWDYQVPATEVNHMVDVTNVPASDKARYLPYLNNPDPNKPLLIGKGWKAHLDCLADFTWMKALNEIFTQNW
jgi:hypothetical protein